MFNDFLKPKLLDNTVLEYFIALGIFFISLAIIKIFKCIVLKKLKVWSEKTENTLDDFIVEVFEKLAIPFAYIAVFLLSIKYLKLTKELDKITDVLIIAILTIFGVRLFTRLISFIFKSYMVKQGRINLDSSMKGILNVLKFIIWALALIFFLDNLGFRISTVIAGLGVGGVAIAIAAQAVLKDLFSYFAIIFDSPFEVGDFLIVDDLMGTVENIGIKTTRVRSLGGEELVFSNSDLTDSRIRNYKRMSKRRVVFKLGVVYSTRLEDLKQIPKEIERIIKSIENAAFDRAHFFSYGDFSLIFEVVYHVLTGDYNKYMDTQQEINFSIKEEFEKRNIEFAFPTQTIYTVKQS